MRFFLKGLCASNAAVEPPRQPDLAIKPTGINRPVVLRSPSKIKNANPR